MFASSTVMESANCAPHTLLSICLISARFKTITEESVGFRKTFSALEKPIRALNSLSVTFNNAFKYSSN